MCGRVLVISNEEHSPKVAPGKQVVKKSYADGSGESVDRLQSAGAFEQNEKQRSIARVA